MENYTINSNFINKSENYTKTRNKSYQIPTILLSLVFSFFFIIDDFGISATLISIIMFIILFLCIFINFNVYFRYKPSKIFICYTLLIFVIILNIRDLDYYLVHPFYIFMLFYVLLCFPFFNISTNENILKILLIPALIASIVIVLNQVSPSAYKLLVLSNISSSSREHYYYLKSEGYGAVLGSNIGLTACYLSIGVLISYYSLFKSKRHRLFNIILFLLFLVSMFLLNRRGELICILLVIIIMPFFVLNWRQKTNYFAILFMMLIAFILLLLCINVNGFVYNGSNRLFSMLNFKNTSIDISNGRNTLYKIAINLFLQNPIVGIGWGGYRKYGSKQIAIVNNVHNIYLQLLTEIGLIGFICVAIIILILLYNLAKKCRKFKRIDCFFAISTTIYILLFGLLDNPIFQDYFLLFFVPLILITNNSIKKRSVNL